MAQEEQHLLRTEAPREEARTTSAAAGPCHPRCSNLFATSLACTFFLGCALASVSTSRGFHGANVGALQVKRALPQQATPRPLPCETECARSNVSVWYAIKSSSKPEYIRRAATILSTWGRWRPERMALISDDSDQGALGQLQHVFPSVKVVEVPNVTHFGDYHEHTPQGRHMAFIAQRRKTRAVLRRFLEDRNESILCYFDDDVYIHVPNLEFELSEFFMTCKSCMLADLRPKTRTPNQGWCMTRHFVQQVLDALGRGSGDWHGTDDSGFKTFLEHNHLAPHGSDLWFGQYVIVRDDGPSGGVHEVDGWSNLSKNTKNKTKLAGFSMLHAGKLVPSWDVYGWHDEVNRDVASWRAPACTRGCAPLDKAAWREACGTTCREPEFQKKQYQKCAEAHGPCHS